MQDIATLGLRVDARQVRDGEQALDGLTRSGARAENQAERTGAAMARMARMAAAVASALAVSEVVKYAEAWASLQGKLALVTGSQAELARVTDALYQSAQRTRTGLDVTVGLYTSLTRSTKELNKTDAERLAVTETINKALIVSGASAQSADGALRQLNQAFASGVLRGDEFNSVLEASPRLIEAIGAGMGKTMGEMRALAAEGKLTSAAIFSALQSQGAAISAEFDKMPTTVAQAMTQIQNSLLRTVGVFDQQNKLSSGLAQSLSGLAENMSTLVAAATGLAVAMGTKWIVESIAAIRARILATNAAAAADNAAAVNAARLGMIQSAAAATAANAELARARAVVASATGLQRLTLQMNVLAPAEARATAAALAHVGAQNALAAASARAAAGITLASRALSIMGGPIGVITTLLGLGATAWMMWGNKAKEAESKATEAVEKSTNEIVEDLDKQIARLKERNALAKVAPEVAKGDTEAARRAAALQMEINEANAGNGRYAGQSETMRALAVINLTEQLNPLIARTRELAKAQEDADTVRAGDKMKSFLDKNSQYQTSAEKLNEELEKAKAHFGGMIPPDVEKRIRATFAAADMKKFNKDQKDAAAERADALNREADAREKRYAAEQQYNAALSAADAPLQARIDAATEEAERNEQLARNIGLTTLQIEQRTLAELEGQLAQAASVGMTEREVEVLQKLIALKQRNVTALGTLGAGTADTTAAKDMLAIMEALDDATRSAAQGMADAFGEVGSAIGSLTTAMSGYQRTQTAIAAKLAEDEKAAGSDKVKLDKARMSAAQQSAQAQLRSYGDMAKAAKGFFKENSAGYRAMEGAEKAYRAMEMALAIKTMVEKSGLLTAFTSLFVTGKTVEATAATTSAGVVVGANTAIGTSAAAAGVATQALGDPYTAWGRMAAMAAAMAALGFAVSGGGRGDTTAKDRQAATGTGSVLGDPSAKSESIKRAIELSAANSNIELNYTQGMLRALLSIESQIGNFASVLLRSTDVNGKFGAENNKRVFDAKGVGIAGGIGGAVAGAAGGAFLGMGAGMLSILGGPITMILGGLLGAILGKNFLGKALGKVFGGEQSVVDSGFTLGKSNMSGIMSGNLNAMQYADIKKDGGWFRGDKYSTKTEGIGGEGNRQIASILTSMYDAVSEAGKILGLGGDAFTQKLNAFVVDIGKISTKDLKPEEIQAQLEAAFSKVGDDMARWAVDGLTKFQKAGEGALETLVRVASNYANLDAILHSVGMEFGQVGLTSIAARENLIELAGGIDKLAEQTSSFASNFLTEAERLAPVQKHVTDQLAQMGLSALDTREKFKAYLLSLDPAIESEQRQIVALLALQDAFAKTHAATVDLTKSQQEIADERAELLDRLEEATMTEVQLAMKRRNALDASNRSLFDQVEAAEAQKKANDALRESMGQSIERFKNHAQGLRDYGQSLLTGNLSPLTLVQQADQAKAQLDSLASRALAGDEAAMGKVQEAANKFLSLSQQVNGGNARYTQDYQAVLSMVDQLARYSDSRVSAAQMHIDAMDRVAEATWALADMLRARDGAIVGATPAATADNSAVVAELAALRAELRARDEAAQKLQIDAANMQRNATVQSGDKVVEAVTATAPRNRPRAMETSAQLDQY